MSDHIAIRLRVYGRVQGVSFRVFVADAAAREGISGFVRNRKDGSVEALLCGPKDAVTRVEAACGQGPAGARVERVDCEPALGLVANRFDIKPTV